MQTLQTFKTRIILRKFYHTAQTEKERLMIPMQQVKDLDAVV